MVHNTSFLRKLKQRMQGSTRKIEESIVGIGENEGGGTRDNDVAPQEQKEDEDEDKNVLSNRMISYKSSGTDRGRGGRGGGHGGGRGGHGLAGRRSDTLSVEL